MPIQSHCQLIELNSVAVNDKKSEPNADIRVTGYIPSTCASRLTGSESLQGYSSRADEREGAAPNASTVNRQPQP